jgi:integrase
MPLTDTTIKAAKPRPKPQRLFDGGGLYLEISPAGGRWWRLKYRHGGKEKRLSLGTYPDTSLKQARERRDEARRLLADGLDPGEERKANKAEAQLEADRAFKAVALAWMQHSGARWGERTRGMVLASLTADAFPKLGTRAIGSIRAADVIEVVQAVEARGAGDTAARVLQRIRAVFRYAVVHQGLTTNPTLDVKADEVLKPRRVTHRAALPESELSTFLAKLDAYDGDPATAGALRLLLLTVVRPGELRGACWSEIDLAAQRWRIPAARMKMKTEHLVPLSRQAVTVLRQAEQLRQAAAGSGEPDLVFPSPYYVGKALSENTLNSALARMGFKGIVTAHGFRALFSTVANECGHDPDVIERHLAHAERNEVRAAYHRAAYIDARAALVQWWADYLDGKRAGQVVPIGNRARKRAARP